MGAISREEGASQGAEWAFREQAAARKQIIRDKILSFDSIFLGILYLEVLHLEGIAYRRLMQV
jgi:hypothetical protein